ncbi:SLBB domain-containing protein [Gammaproteobacteria bacterium]|nr:SLBB domain-containing protein [Gammaproteobacteria bacterium]
MAEDFLEGLPPSVREEIEVQNQVEQEEDLEKLFRSDTSVEKNKVILRNLQEQLRALELRLTEDDDNDLGTMKRFGDSFFQSFQSSFMPVNVPNIGSNYIVDVGDVFKLTRSGQKNDTNELMVGRDGTLELPGSGKIQVAGRTLNQVEELVNSLIEATQIGTTHMLSLKKLRDVQIIIVGGVENPGIYTLSGGSNILGGLHVAGGISKSGSFRAIELRRDGNTIAKYDLYDLFISGQYDNKNTLRSGDTVFVSQVNFQVPVAGGVHNAAIFELTDDETLKDLIDFAGGFNESFYGFNKVLVTRNLPQNRTIESIPVDALDSFKLRPRDSVMVPSYSYKSNDLYKVTIEGRVKRPGTYFVLPGETLSTLVNRAGGYERDAYEYGAALFRQEAINQEERYAQLNYSDTLNYIVSSLGKPGINISSDVLGLLAEEVRATNFLGRVIAEFNISALKNQPELNIPLENNDRIVVPSLQKIVYMFGDFKNNLNASYKPEYTIKDYINLAGGLKDSAYNEIIVIDPDGKTQIYSKNIFSIGRGDIDVYPGSIIYAPRNISKINGIQYAATISPIISSVALSLASLNSINN